MGASDIVRSALQSELVRSQIGQAGKRVFKANLQTPQKDEDDNIIGWLWNAGERVVSLIGNFFNLVGIGFSALWSIFTTTAQYIYRFDWNMSDTQIDQQIQNSWNALGSMLGGTLGNAFGYLACGVLPAATILAFNEPLGAHLLQNVSQELAEEVLSNLSNLIRYTFQSGVTSLLLWSYKNVRKFIKSNVNFIQSIFGEGYANVIRAWAAPGSKPWSFAKAVEEQVESIPNTFLRNFVEEFLEEAWEGCVEAGYVIANGIDSYLAAEKLKQQQTPILGKNRYVEITPDRSNDREKIILAGPQQALKASIVQTLSSYQLIENRDIGSMIGMPADDYLRAKPQTLRIIVVMTSVQSPPFISSNGQRLTRATYSIPDLKRSKCNWEDIKAACGGTNGYMWGRYRCTGVLSNGRQMQVMGASPDEAEDRLRAFLTLSEATLVKKPTISEDRAEDNTGSYIKQPKRLYPAYFTIMNQYKVAGSRGSGIPLSDGIYNRKNDKIILYTNEKPLGTDERIAELLTMPGAQNP